jgi:hypothetical protein
MYVYNVICEVKTGFSNNIKINKTLQTVVSTDFTSAVWFSSKSNVSEKKIPSGLYTPSSCFSKFEVVRCTGRYGSVINVVHRLIIRELDYVIWTDIHDVH